MARKDHVKFSCQRPVVAQERGKLLRESGDERFRTFRETSVDLDGSRIKGDVLRIMMSMHLFGAQLVSGQETHNKLGTRAQLVVEVDEPVRHARASSYGDNECRGSRSSPVILDLKYSGCLERSHSRGRD